MLTDKEKELIDQLFVGKHEGRPDLQITPMFFLVLVHLNKKLDSYIEHRITADKTLEGILKDIQGNIVSIAENGIAIDKREK